VKRCGGGCGARCCCQGGRVCGPGIIIGGFGVAGPGIIMGGFGVIGPTGGGVSGGGGGVWIGGGGGSSAAICVPLSSRSSRVGRGAGRGADLAEQAQQQLVRGGPPARVLVQRRGDQLTHGAREAGEVRLLVEDPVDDHRECLGLEGGVSRRREHHRGAPGEDVHRGRQRLTGELLGGRG